MHCITATIDAGNVKGKQFLKKNYYPENYSNTAVASDGQHVAHS